MPSPRYGKVLRENGISREPRFGKRCWDAEPMVDYCFRNTTEVYSRRTCRASLSSRSPTKLELNLRYEQRL